MIFPIKVSHSIVKTCGIICPLTNVENVIFVRMFLIHEFLDLYKDDVNEYSRDADQNTNDCRYLHL